MIFTILQGSCQKLMLFLTDGNFSDVDWYADYRVERSNSLDECAIVSCVNDGYDVDDVVVNAFILLDTNFRR